MAKYSIINHYDVWGNADDGFTVNDSSIAGTISLNNNPSDDQIISSLVEIGFFNDHVTADMVDINGYDLTIDIDSADDGMPLCQLQLLH